MANKPRQYHEGYWYHVYARSLDELRLFVADEEREWFIEKLDAVFTRRNVKLGALCLMDTHYHAIVKMGSIRLDRVFQGLHMSYAKHLNHERDRDGPVFRERPGADIVLDDSYLLQLVPYIHKNPVEAGIVTEPSDYKWHTDRLYRGGNWEPGPLESWQYPPNFGGNNRHRVYKERMGEDTGELKRGEGYIGSDDEWSKLERRDEDRQDRFRERRGRRSMNEIAESIAEEYDIGVEPLQEPGRAQKEASIRHEAMVEMYEEGYGPTEIGDYFNRNKGSVVYAVNKENN
jgi:REP element-mobilizing transposase RayT